jgi:6,7-dimethyl-8-ribityllumazine synthase|tara:strand:- start:296 stop:691 length:396 start_codon:yes stop_codon:yes gene_type:complete
MKFKICIVISTYNNDITENLYLNAKKELDKFSLKKIDIVKVPGSFEIPVVISKLAKKYDGFIAIGCVIKGETANFDLISKAITNGIMEISISQKKPIGNAVITSFNREQALKRFNRGKEAAQAILEVLKIK